MGHPTWPLYDLRLRTPDLELRLPDEDEPVDLCRVARSGAEHHHFQLTRDRWRAHRYCEVEMEGLAAYRDMFGA